GQPRVGQPLPVGPPLRWKPGTYRQTGLRSDLPVGHDRRDCARPDCAWPDGSVVDSALLGGARLGSVRHYTATPGTALKTRTRWAGHSRSPSFLVHRTTSTQCKSLRYLIFSGVGATSARGLPAAAGTFAGYAEGTDFEPGRLPSGACNADGGAPVLRLPGQNSGGATGTVGLKRCSGTELR